MLLSHFSVYKHFLHNDPALSFNSFFEQLTHLGIIIFNCLQNNINAYGKPWELNLSFWTGNNGNTISLRTLQDVEFYCSQETGWFFIIYL